MDAEFSVVIPARDAERTLPAVLRALAAQDPPPAEVIVVDDGSVDRTVAIAREHGARVITAGGRSAGGARNLGWAEAAEPVVVFLDADAVPSDGWSRGLTCALREFPGAVVGCARTFTADTRWEWVAHLQVETPYLPNGPPRDVSFVSSYCIAVPRDAQLRWDESYGGEDAIFCADAQAVGMRIVFDPRFHAHHVHERRSFRDLRTQQTRFAYGLARCGVLRQQGTLKRVLSRFPVHYFLLARLAVIYRRVRRDRALRNRFLRLLPYLVVAEWTLGLSALRYAVSRPVLRVESPRRVARPQTSD